MKPGRPLQLVAYGTGTFPETLRSPFFRAIYRHTALLVHQTDLPLVPSTLARRSRTPTSQRNGLISRMCTSGATCPRPSRRLWGTDPKALGGPHRPRSQLGGDQGGGRRSTSTTAVAAHLELSSPDHGHAVWLRYMIRLHPSSPTPVDLVAC
jgi:hypothetical protein